MDTEVCHVMLAGHIYKLSFMLLCLVTVLRPFHQVCLLWRNSLQLFAQTRPQHDLQEFPFSNTMWTSYIKWSLFLYFLLFCLVVNTSADLLPHAVFVRAQCWPDQAEDCRLCYCFFQPALHVITEWSSVVAQHWDYQMPPFVLLILQIWDPFLAQALTSVAMKCTSVNLFKCPAFNFFP